MKHTDKLFTSFLEKKTHIYIPQQHLTMKLDHQRYRIVLKMNDNGQSQRYLSTQSIHQSIEELLVINPFALITSCMFSLHITKGADKKNLFKNQELFKLLNSFPSFL